MSVEIQNEIIEVLSNVVKKKILKNLQSADTQYFTVKVDGTRDATNIENISIILRYVKEGNVHEDLIDMEATKNLHATAISNTVLQCLRQLGVDPNFILSQCYDGASVMAGIHGGVQRKLQDAFGKFIPYVHCFNHQLHLVVIHTISSINEVKQFFGICESLYTFTRRPNISICYDGEKLKRLLTQRWSGHLASLETIIANHNHLIDLFEACKMSQNLDADTMVQATGLLKWIRRKDFVFLALALRDVLNLIQPANLCLPGSFVCV